MSQDMDNISTGSSKSSEDSKDSKKEFNDDIDLESDVDDDYDSEMDDLEENEDAGSELELDTKISTQQEFLNPILGGDDAEDDDDENDDPDYLQKFDESLKKNIIADWHPEEQAHNDEEVETMCNIVRDANNFIIDPLHKTLPFITKYEKARILGERAKQLDAGAKPFISIKENMIDSYLIALKEYEMKKIPFIIRRPLPNGACEYWRLRDLEFID